VPRLWRSGMLRNRVPALPGWADVWRGGPTGLGTCCSFFFGLSKALSGWVGCGRPKQAAEKVCTGQERNTSGAS
jgi:hypothetical protein